MRLSKRPCPSCSPAADVLFVGLACESCKTPVTFPPLDHTYIGIRTQRPVYTAEQLRANKNARRQARRAAMTPEQRAAMHAANRVYMQRSRDRAKAAGVGGGA